MSTQPSYLWLDGQVVPWESATIHIADARDLASTTSVFEGIRGYWNDEREQMYIFRLADHLRRLAYSMKVLRMQPTFTIPMLTEAIIELIRRNGQREDVYIRPVATYAPGTSVTRQTGPSQIEMLIYITPSPSSLGLGGIRRVGVSSWSRISDNALPPRVKANANYLASRLVTMQALADGYDGAIILNTDGKVAEGPWACVGMVRDGRLITPTLTSNVLESITRHTVIQVAQEVLDMAVEERAIDRTELYLADELFFCGTGAEVTPIVAVDRYAVGDGEVGPYTRHLQTLYQDIVRGREARYEGWLTPVY